MIKQRNDNLTKEDELNMGIKIQKMIGIKDKIKNKEKITDEDLKDLEEGQEAFELLIGNYYNLARKIVRQHHSKTGTRYSLEDLDQDAILALIEAAITYDPIKNCKLGTHAYYKISKMVTSTINYQRLVRLPENKMGDYIKISKLQKAYGELSNIEKAQYENELDYVYKNIDISKDNVDLILRTLQPQVSLNAPIYENDSELMDTLVDETAIKTVTKLENLDDRLIKVLKQLNDFEKDLVAFEYGLFPPSMELKNFKSKYQLSDHELRLETSKINKKMKKIGSKLS